MAGTKNDVLVGKNADFSQVAGPNSGSSESNGLISDGDLWIGTTAVNAGGTHINVGSLTSPGGSLTIGYSSPNITLDVAGGGAAVEEITVDNSTAPGTNPVLPSGGNITITGAQVANASLSNVIQTHSFAANSFAVSIQRAAAAAAADVNKNGVCHFDSIAFNVDANAFVKTGIDRYPITRYVVGPLGYAGYQTIQSALDAANAAGSGAVWVMPGSYTENLTLYPSSQIVGAVSNSDAPLGSAVVITGVHTPPATGFVSFSTVLLSSATDVFNSAVAGDTILVLENCTTNCTNGYTFNVPNWTGFLVEFNCQQADTNNGVVNNSGGAPVFFESSNVGQGTGNTMITSGFVHFNEVDLMCPWNCTTGTILDLDTVTFSQTVTFSNDTTGTIRWATFSTGATPAFTMSSTAAISILHAIISSSNAPAITGAGVGTLTYEDFVFTSNASFAGTLTLATTSWQPYARAIAATDGTKVGTCAFDSAAFDVDASGFVQLNGGGIASTSFDVQANTAPGTDPVVPTSSGVVTVNGAAVANHSVVLETRSRAANAYNVEVQYATSAAATDATKSGVAHFNSTQFSVDANGFVALAGGGLAIDSFVPDSGTNPVVPAANGSVTLSGSGSITSVGGLNTLTYQLSGLTNHNVLIGAGTTTITKVAPSATSGVPLISQGASADPTFGTAVVAGGGTGATSFTAHGVLIGEGTSAVVALGAGSAGQVLQSGGAAADPAYSTATYPSTATGTGKILRADGTNWSATTATYPSTAGTSGNLLTSDGTNFVSSAPVTFQQVVIQKFTADGTYTPTSGMKYCIIECLGGGGGGGGSAGAAGQSSSAGGGGSGSYSRKVSTAAAIGVSQAVTVGGGGNGGTAGNNNGSAGNDTSVGVICIGKGGSGGGGVASGLTVAGGSGGVAGTGDFTPTGNPGGSGMGGLSVNYTTNGGYGGCSVFGGGGKSQVANNTTAAGNNATNYGSGGSGACSHNSASSAAGGNGSAGVVIITEYI